MQARMRVGYMNPIKANILGRVKAVAKKTVAMMKVGREYIGSVQARQTGDLTAAQQHLARAAELKAEYYRINCVDSDFIARYTAPAKPVFPDEVHLVLGIAGMIPVFGFIADAVDGVLYLGEGRTSDAGISFISSIPFFGDGTKLAKEGVEFSSIIILGSKGFTKATKITSPNQMRKLVESGRAPRTIDRVDDPHLNNTPNQMPHIHFKDGTSINIDGTVHDKSHGQPNLDNKTKEWLEENGWKTGD